MLVVDRVTYRWSLSHRHRVEHDGGPPHYHGCTERLAVRRDGAPGRLEMLFEAGPGRLVPDGLLHSGGVIHGEDYLNLHQPRVVRALLDEALARGWRPTDPAHVTLDGWMLCTAVVLRLRAARRNSVAPPGLRPQTRPMTSVRVQVAGHGEHLDEAATIWAEATAARDGTTEVAPLSLARPVIEQVTDRSPRSMLLVALDPDGVVLGFAAVEPMPADGSTADVRYLAVHPGSWGSGVGRQLMLALPAHLAVAGFTHGELDVYLDNPRAVDLYERHGWLPSGDPTPHPRSGRLEQRFRLELQPA
ncbi:GNAT family N-acetyltransferase [Dactylosporangium siamense]|uniref:GNAT family N-acetyltransferase n=1 Tax=Dactylosporangium siamense TaxID=685454 RepID=UPI001944F3BB|nr:GNAT family N-acetyltransferase [Dactylosporangium siamense]